MLVWEDYEDANIGFNCLPEAWPCPNQSDADMYCTRRQRWESTSLTLLSKRSTPIFGSGRSGNLRVFSSLRRLMPNNAGAGVPNPFRNLASVATTLFLQPIAGDVSALCVCVPSLGLDIVGKQRSGSGIWENPGRCAFATVLVRRLNGDL
jgi:hypothetical protein